MERAREFGGLLFDALFSSRVRDLYRDCFASARADGKGLRLKLSLGQVPELTDVPWEYLYDSPAFLSISQFTPVVRYLELPRARAPLAVEHPLRVLAMISAPRGMDALDVEDERRKVEQALQGRLLDDDLVEITWLEQATLRALQRELRRGPYHVFHFIGHGAYDSGLGESVLLLEDEDGRARPVSGAQLGTILADHTSLRLAVLNACEGARTSRDDPFSGVAAALVQHELPAVIAMQFEITDRAAIIFAEEFYAALVDGLPVDAALAETRKAIYADGNDIEWGTPVLFMRVRDGRIFELPKRPAEEAVRVAVEQATAERAVQEQAERQEAVRVAVEQATAERAVQEQAERQEAERVAVEQATAERAVQEQAERQEAERVAAEQATAERAVQEQAERQEAERVAVEQAEAERAVQEQAERQEAERVAVEQAEAERAVQEQAERQEAERVAVEQAEAERAVQEQAERQEAERVAGERNPMPKQRPTRGARLRGLIPRRTWTRLAALGAIVSLVGAVAVVVALALTGRIGGEADFVGATVAMTPVKGSKSTGSSYIYRSAGEEAGTVNVYANVSGDRGDVFAILLFNDIADVESFTSVPPGAKRLEGGITPSYSGNQTLGDISAYPTLPANYRDFSFVGVTRKPAGERVRHLELYVPIDKLDESEG